MNLRCGLLLTMLPAVAMAQQPPASLPSLPITLSGQDVDVFRAFFLEMRARDALPILTFLDMKETQARTKADQDAAEAHARQTKAEADKYLADRKAIAEKAVADYKATTKTVGPLPSR